MEASGGRPPWKDETISGLVVLVAPGAEAQRVEKMLATAAHRGTNYNIRQGDGWAIGIQSRDEEDPFVSSGIFTNEQVAVATSGCLYQVTAIIPGDQAASTVADIYLTGGIKALEHITGSISAVIIDHRSIEVIAYRSAVGERPLFFTSNNNDCAFSSEVKQLLQGPFPKREVDMDTVLDLVAGSFKDIERTCYQQVARVKPGSTLQFRNGIIEKRIFWDPAKLVATAKISFEEAIAEMRRLMQQAVERRMRKGTGLLLSGGLDSSAIAVHAAPLHQQRYGEPLRAVSASYPEFPTVDETEFTKQTAEVLGIDVTRCYPKPKTFTKLKERAWLHDGPDRTPFSDNFEQILGSARKIGLRSLMDGHDGDSALGAIPRVMHAILRRGHLGVAYYMFSNARQARHWSIPRALRSLVGPAFVDFAPWLRDNKLRARWFPSIESPTWAKGPLKSRFQQPSEPWGEGQSTAISVNLVLALEHLCRMSQLGGLGLLHPWADPQLISFLLTIPPEWKFWNGTAKALVRQGYLEISGNILGRRKVFFSRVARASAAPNDIAAAIRSSAGLVPGTNWSQLQDQSEELIEFPEWSRLNRLLSADAFLGAA